jgi:YidC/Oxa1 family membrane protein insertase
MGFLSHWRDYRAFRKLPVSERRLVYYSESAQDWHHIEPVIEYLTQQLDETIIYVTSDEFDPGLHQDNDRIRGFCIGTGLFRILWFQTLQADVLATQLLDLNNFDLKRSVHPVHYVYLFHSLISTHMADHVNSFDHYDTILCSGPHQVREIRKREAMLGLDEKQLLPHGYHRLEDLIANRREPPAINDTDGIHVLLAPSWGDETILNLCGLELTEALLDAGFRVTLRPHYQTRWNTPEVIDRITSRFADHPKFNLVEEMGESDSLFDSHVMITDWSGAGMDYGMGLEKPVLYIDVPPKSRNEEWKNLGIEPFESFVRDKIGAILAPDRIEAAPALIRDLLSQPDVFRQQVRQLREQWVFNPGTSTVAGARALVTVADQVADARAAADA